ncbi:MAG: glycoside hydrolase family 3 C-terminal domain-containing protein, partial [Bacteroidales bacterium]|nr:glycoside hydrolase family 3 C-terminal domain-containing protein [Bacteroidales bacterium]
MKKTSSHVLRGVAGIFLALLVIFGTVSSVANSWAGKVNELLGVDQATITRSSDPADYRYQSDYATASELIQAEIDLNTRLAAEGSVALKGQPALGGTKVTLFGMRSGAKMQFGGSMGELIEASNVVTLGEAMEANGFSVNPTMLQFYKDMEANYAPTRSSGGNVVNSYEGQGAAIGEVPVSEYSAASLEGYKDAAVIVLGRDAGESACFYPGLNGLSNPAEFTNSPTGNILSLSNEERELVNWVKGQGFGKIVVLLNSSTAMEIDELKRDAAVDSIIWIGNPGAYGTYGIAKLLSGEVLPSGHLPDTFAVNTALSPAAQNYGIYVFSNAAEIDESSNHALRSDWYLAELEGIYTGYKYYETRYFDSVLGQGNAASAPAGQSTTAGKWDYDSEVSYSFGYGLEGSTFTEEIEAIGIDWSGETDSSVRIKVTNTGTVAAKHVVQLYVSVPYTQGGVEKSAIQLVGYAKTGEASEQSF